MSHSTATLSRPPDRPSPVTRRRRPLPASAGVAVVVLVKSALQLAVAGRYGWHSDELYYAAAGRHPAAGYVDFPPVTPLLARLAHALFGDSLVGLRSFAVLAGAGVIVLAALTARALGGGRAAQVLAAVAVAASPMLLGSNAMFQTVSFDQVAWAGVLYLFVRLLRTGDTRLWPAIGLAAGLGLMTKYTIGMLLASVAVGLALTPGGRRHLRSRGPWLAAVVAATVLAPNLWWQAAHGWASVSFLGTHVDHTSRAGSLLELFLLPGLLGLVLGWNGIRLLVRDPKLRPLAWAAGLVMLAFFLLGAKGYYAAPVWLLLLPAGAVRIERLSAATARPWLRTALPAALVVAILPVLPLGLPVLSQGQMVAHGLWQARKDYADEIGWPELVDSVATAFDSLSPDDRRVTAVVTANAGEAGAVDLFGPRRGLPLAVSGNLTYRYWAAPAALDARIAVTVGLDGSWLAPRCTSLVDAGVVTNRAGVDNEEAGGHIWICRPKTTVGSLEPAPAGS